MPQRLPGIPVEAPAGLRAETFELAGECYLIASYPFRTELSVPGLSPAEAAVLAAALDGASNAEIAVVRGRSIHTIQNQVASALRKLGVSSRSEAAALLASRSAG